MKLEIKKGTASKLIEIFISDSSSTTGAGLTGVAFGDITGYYYRSGAALPVTQLAALQTMTVGTWVTEGFIEIDATNMPGYYQLGIPDAALVSGADQVNIMLKGASNMAPLPIEIQLVDNTEKDVFDIVNSGTFGNEEIKDLLDAIAGFLDTEIAAILADTNELQTDWTNAGRLDLLLDAIKAVTDSLPDAGALSDLATILEDTAEIQGKLPTNKIMGSSTAADQDDASLSIAEPSPGVPPATPSYAVVKDWQWMHFRNKGTLNKTTGEAKIYNNAGTELAKGTDTDDGTTFTKGKLGAP